MVFKEILQKIGEKSREKKAMLSQIQEQMRAQKIAEDRMKSSNERELEGYMNEEREAQIKKQLEYMRKKRDEDIKFGHNPLNISNITNHVDWEVLKERNQFKGKGNIFSNQKFILKNNPKLMQNNQRLYAV